MEMSGLPTGIYYCLFQEKETSPPPKKTVPAFSCPRKKNVEKTSGIVNKRPPEQAAEGLKHGCGRSDGTVFYCTVNIFCKNLIRLNNLL
jgi:hypothetical protein